LNIINGAKTKVSSQAVGPQALRDITDEAVGLQKGIPSAPENNMTADAIEWSFPACRWLPQWDFGHQCGQLRLLLVGLVQQ
jgi:hypothetical protein